MKKTAETLERERNDLQRKIEYAFKTPEEIEDNAKNWLRKVTKILEEMRDNIEPRIAPVDRTDCWTKITSSFKLGNKVKATTEEMEELLNEVKGFLNIFRPSPPNGALPISMPPSSLIQSRKQMETDILKSFSQFKVVGIVGMGGLGKTTLAKQILNRMLEDGLVVGAVLVVTQPFDKLKIQEEIARSLGCWSEMEKEKSEEDRARILLSKLKAARFLIVLDDIWEEFTLADVGIPHEGECKTLLTSRNKGLLDNMSPKVFEMEILSEEEARLLFKDKAGTCVDDPPLQSIAKEVVDECKGLTIAIITVGSALKDRRQKVIWEGALRDLRKANPKNIKDVIKNVYNPLRKSIDLLDGPNKDDAKKLLLLCSLFPEDHSIRIEELVLYSMGLQMFKGDNSLEYARYLVHSEIWNLKSRYLLLDGDKEDEVKMHDVVRDVAIYIASEEKLIELENDTAENCCQWISEFVSPRNFLCSPALRRNKFPSLHLLIIHGKKPLHEPEVIVDDLSLLKGMPELFVLSFENVELQGSPNIIEWPKNILTLRFLGCVMMSDLSFVGELLDLEVLDCNMRYGIEALPAEIKKLKNLKLLTWTGAYVHLDPPLHIAPGIISQLTELEELKIMKGWEATEVDGEERMNASLKELESLQKLKCLEIQIGDPTLVNEVIHLSPTVKKYRIWIGKFHPELTYDRAISLSNLKSEINHQSWILKLLATTEVEELCLFLETGLGTWRNIWQLIQKTVQHLKILDCEIIMLVDTSTISQVFPKLRFLDLSVLPDLKQLCDSPLREGSNSFGNLCNVSISGCDMLRNLFLLERGNGVFFQQLETLTIKNCGKMEEAFISDDEHGEEGMRGGTIGFPKLKKLVLKKLGRLRTFAKGFQRIEFPSLEELEIEDCEQLESLVCSQQESDEDKSSPLLCTKKITIGTLKKLIIRRCHNIRAIFSFSIVESLNSLDDIDISFCDKVEEVLRKVKNEDVENIRDFTFPKLESLELSGLLNLTSLGKGIESIKFSVLKILWITCCPNLRNLLSPMEYHIQESREGYHHDDESLSSFWNEKVKCKRMNHLFIEKCGMASSLLSSSAAENLESLKILRIIDCCHMKKVITGGKQMPGNFKLFPLLEKLEIESMPLLEIFCDWKCGLQLLSLRTISVRECPHMGILTVGSLSTPNLNQVDINYMSFGKARLRGNEDLNIFLPKIFMTTRVVPWNMPDEFDPSEPKILKLLNPHTPTKVVQLCYMSSVGEVGILALTSDAAHMLWRWKRIDLRSKYSSAPSEPHLVDTFNGAPMCNESNDSVGCLAVSKGEHFLASASGGKISLFCMDHPIECPTKIFRPPPPVTTYLAFHPEKEDVIAIGMEDSTIQIYNWRDNDILSTLEGHQNRISGLAFSWDCKKLVSSGADAQLCVWRRRRRNHVWEKEKSCYIHTPTEAGHPAPLVGDTRVQFHRNESELLVVHETQFAIYNVELECLRSWYPSDSFPSTVSCATYSRNGQMIFTGFHEGTIGIFNNSENLTLQCRIAPSAYISSSIPSNDNVFPVAIAAHPLTAGQFAVGMSDGAIYVIEPADLQTNSGCSTSEEDQELSTSEEDQEEDQELSTSEEDQEL